MNALNAALGKAKTMLSGFTTGQRAVVAVGVMLFLLGAFALSRWVAQPTMTPMYSGLSGTDASAVVDELNSEGVKYELADGGTTIMVPQSQVYNLRVALAGKGIPANDGNGDSPGWSLLDDQGITATDFQQNVAYQRALEGELQKTLKAINGVNSAVVHIAVPTKDVFSDEQEKTTASVLVSTRAGATLTNDQVNAITNLVAGSVTGLAPEDVTITDQTGKLLSGGTAGGAGGAAQASSADQQTAQYEQRLSDAAQDVLDRVVGTGNSVVRVNAQLNFDSSNVTSQKFTAPSPSVLPQSVATVSEQYSGGGNTAGGTLGQVAPSALAGSGGSGAYNRQQSTVNNNVDQEVAQTKTAPGKVERLTVAVVLNQAKAASLNSTQMQTLVANAVGLDPTRGDAVQVDILPFDNTASAAAAKQLADADKAAKTASYVDMGKKAGIGLLVLIALIIAMRRGKKDKTVEGTASDLPGTTSGLVLPPSNALSAGPSDAAMAELTAQMADRGRVRDDVAALVDNQPDEVAAMLQGWLGERSK
ncbi:flagellar basal-body MS-ring/collar protein FliF [Spongisporangium articulatum]|uniref:Flagellar M-ring protein n=1 Tax=Spongisporangium articulatum TaxID=3362603 RepID=A0ABW8AHM3_9ACTN